jgi:hypothetical protein
MLLLYKMDFSDEEYFPLCWYVRTEGATFCLRITDNGSHRIERVR